MFYVKTGISSKLFGPFSNFADATIAKQMIYAVTDHSAEVIEEVVLNTRVFTPIEIEFLRDVYRANSEKLSAVRMIKYVRELASCGLKEAKDFYDLHIRR